jgi:nucleotide-binding universal stress UspA family protein
MSLLSRILLPADFSERSTAAARYANAIAGHFHSQIILVHVLIPPQYEFGALEITGSMLAELYRGRMQQATADLEAMSAELTGVDVRRVVLEGDPAARIVELAHEQQVSAILMPTHGYGPFRRFILGSNTAKVLHDADCPVWTGVHLENAQPAAEPPFRTVLCAVDLGSQSSKTLCWAAVLARESGAKLVLLHVTATEMERAGAGNLAAAAKEELSRLLEFVHADAEIAIDAGEPAAAICAAAARIHADVLVIGRGSAAGVFGRLRTNAYSIIRQSPCPVVSV